MAKKDATPLGPAIQSWLRTMRLKQGLNQVDIRETWNKITGPEIAEHCLEVNLRGDQLYVKLDSDLMRQELGFAAERLVKHLNESLESEMVKRIHFF